MQKQLGMPAMNKKELNKPLNKQQFRIMAL